MVDVVSEIDIDCPKENVVAFAADPGNAKSCYKNIKSVTWITSPPLVLHSRIAFEASFLGKQLSYVYDVMEWVPGERLLMRTSDGPFPMETVYKWTTVNDGMTRMTLRNRGQPTGFS